MYKNIMHALIDAGKTKKDLAADLGWSYTRCRDKLSGKVKITFRRSRRNKGRRSARSPTLHRNAVRPRKQNRVNAKDIKSK